MNDAFDERHRPRPSFLSINTIEHLWSRRESQRDWHGNQA